MRALFVVNAFGGENLNEEEFEKIKAQLIEKLVASILEDKELFSGWMYDISKLAVNSNDFNAFKSMLKNYILYHEKAVEKFAPTPKVEIVNRPFYRCDGCKMRIMKGMVVSVIDGKRLCLLCSLSLIRLKSIRINGYISEIIRLFSHRD